MDERELRQLSARELVLYQELAETYRGLLSCLEEGAPSAESAVFGEASARAEQTTTALRDLSAALAPYRFDGSPVPESVMALWRASASTAGQALDANAALLTHARRHRDLLATRLTALAGARQGLAGYRPAAERRAGAANRCA